MPRDWLIMPSTGRRTPVQNSPVVNRTSRAALITGPARATPVVAMAGRGSLINSGIVSTVFNFLSGAIPAGISFARASGAWALNNAGVLTSYLSGVPRFTVDPVTLTPLGLLVEGGRTNSLRNSTAVGAVIGSPGTPPTSWVSGGVTTGLTREILGTGVEDGIEYIDWHIFGTPAQTNQVTMEFESRTAIAAADGQVWAASVFVRLIGGSLAGLTSVTFTARYWTAAVGVALQPTVVPITPTNAPLRTQRSFQVSTAANVTVSVNNQVNFNYALNVPIDFTVRIGLPQLELGEGPTSPIKTTNVGTVTRISEVVTITDPNALTYQAFGIKGRTPAYLTVSSQQDMLDIDDGSASNRRALWRTVGSNNMTLLNASATVINAQFNAGVVVVNTDFGMAGRFKLDDYAASVNGAAVVTDLAGAMATGVNTARIGSLSGNVHWWNSTIKSIEMRPTATNPELQMMATLP